MGIQAKTELEPSQIKALLKEYYGFHVVDIHKVRAVYKVETDQGTFALKNAKKIKDIDFIHSVVQHLHAHGFQYVPMLEKTTNNQLLLHHHDHDYVVEQWLPPEVKEVGVYDDSWLFSAGKAIAAFHQAIQTYSKADIPRARVRKPWGDWFVRRYKQIKHSMAWDQSPEKYWLLDRMKLMKDQYREHPHLTAMLCHGSLHQENIMIDPQKQVWLIDYERLTYDAVGKDLAQVLTYHFRFHPWNKEAVEQLLAGYQSVCPLQTADLFHVCARCLVPEKMIYACIDGKALIGDWEQERRKEEVLQEVFPAYWK